MATLEEIKKLQSGLSLEPKPELKKDSTLIGGTAASALQGLTFGFSDEISASVGALGSIFTDESFSEAFDRRVKDARQDLLDFREANPKLALGGEIAGSVAPVAISLLLTPFTGGASASGAAVTATRILSNPLLAGKVAKPGLNLLQRTAQGAKIGALQGAVAGAGYGEGGVIERAISSGLGAGAGTALGAAATPILAGTGAALRTGKELLTKPTSKFNTSETKSLKIIADQFAKDEIPLESIPAKIQENVNADKLVGLTPVEILADYGGDAVNRKLRGIKTRVPGMNIEEQLIERTAGTTKQKADALKNLKSPSIQSERILKEFETSTKKVVKTPNINLEGGVDDLSNTIDGYLSPLYAVAFEKNNKVNNINLYKSLLQTPLMRSAYEDSISVYREKLISQGQRPQPIPKLNDLFEKNNKGQIIGMKKYLPLEFLDLIKKTADQKTFQNIRDGSINKQTALSRKKLANNFRNLLKESTLGDEYEKALDMGADKFALQDAFNSGVEFHKPSLSAINFNKVFKSLNTDIEKDAFKIGVFQQIYKDINKAGDNINLVKKIFDSPDLRQKLTILFGNDIDARSQFVNRLVRESVISKNTATITGGSNTAEKVLDAADVAQTLSDVAVYGTAPTSSAGIRAGATLFQKARAVIANPTEKRAREVGNLLLEQNPNRQQEVMDEVLKLQKQLQKTKEVEDTITRTSVRYGSQLFPQSINE